MKQNKESRVKKMFGGFKTAFSKAFTAKEKQV